MSKTIVDQFIFKLFIIMLAFDVITVVYMTPKVEQTVQQTPEQNKTTTAQDEQEQQDKQNKSSKDNLEGNEEETEPFKAQQNDDDLKGILVIQHCSSHQAELDSLKTIFKEMYPSVTFESSIYPLSPIKDLLSKFLQYIHWIMLALNLFGDKIFGFLQMPYPSWYILMKEKKMIVLGVVLVGSMFLSGIVNKTHAFEVYYEGEQIYSKLQNGIIPTVDQIDAILQDGIKKSKW